MKSATSLMTLGSLGLELALTVGIGVWLGLKFDAWAGVSPVGVLAGVLVAVLGSIWRLMVVLKLMDRHRKTDASSDEPPQVG